MMEDKDTFEGVDDDLITRHRMALVKPEKRFEHRLSSGVKVSVWKADLFRFNEADAVVNAANTSLSHGGGLAQAGGPQIQQESRDYIRKYGSLKTGDAVALSAGFLPYKKIIHAVGPDLPMNPTRSEVNSAELLLKKAIENILKRVSEEGLSSVAIPAISSGLFNYPLPQCAWTIVSAVKKFYDSISYQEHRPTEVFFVNNDEPTVNEMEKACRQILGSGPPSYSQVAGPKTTGATKGSDTTVQMGQVTLTLKSDLIQDQQTDVIVNTASEDRDLQRGAVSKALLNKAGYEMQNEVKRAKKNKHIVTTKPYKLKCKEVYHTFCVAKSRHNSQKIFHDSISECLWTAASAGHKSISFPAIGTGNLGFPEKEAASIMLDAVMQFSKNCPTSMAVYIVIYHSDQHNFQAFKDQMKNIQKQSPKPSYEHAGPVGLLHSTKLGSPEEEPEISEPSALISPSSAAEPAAPPSRKGMGRGSKEESSDPALTQLPEPHRSGPQPPSYFSDEHFLLGSVRLRCFFPLFYFHFSSSWVSDQTMEDKVEISLQEFPFVQDYGRELSEIIDSKFGCLITLEGVDGAASGTKHRRAPAKPEKRFEHRLSSGVKVSVWKADLCCFNEADAVVNAANTSLSHGGGLAQALSDAGGPQIQQESLDYIRKYGHLKTGDAVALSAGSLPYKKVIHAVGPDLSMNPTRSEVNSAEPFLKKAIENILKRVSEERLSSVAIPAISSGLFNYPLPDCAGTIVSAVKKFYDSISYREHRPKEVFFVNNDEPTVSEMEKACRQILGSGPPSYSQVAGPNTRGATKGSDTTVQMGQVTLTLKSDLIQDQQTDVIVNTASEDLDLKKGAVSKALLEKAGYEMQKEILKAKRINYIIPTTAHKLKSREVYHTFCVEKSRKDSQKIFLNSILECLWTAASDNHKSISFPAIGTGNLKFSEKEAASIMLDAVMQFSQSYPNSMAVYFVIYHSDHKVFQAFKDQMKNIHKQFPKPNYEHQKQAPKSNYEHENRDFFQSSKKPQIILHGPSRESIHEAEKWLKDLLFSSKDIIINNNFIQHFGKNEFHLLSRWNRDGVFIEVFLTQGHACIQVSSKSKENLFGAVVKVEALLCQVQKKFVSEEEQELQLHSVTTRQGSRQTVDHRAKKFSQHHFAFGDQQLQVVKVEQVENPALEVMFNMKKDQMSLSTPQTMFQCISAQFCDMICKIGCHADCAPPDDTLYGEGIYFTNSIKEALKVWKSRMEEYVYFVEAEVLTGNTTQGKQGLILPPPVGNEPDKLFDSVYGGSGTSVIFSGYQALPKYIITCKRW
ncbi:hypothetical protein OJAV_G00203380 [Oryzias javanicus]|uniref:Poly [ADP-ribose] polymerase n=1 Tax=Oryzias javanicus TaxID=123683 RepID=A0A437C5B2_ORYJA|nr:hypothetical protein OJAV_G00203380 [Oryzias javanicus]